VIPIQRAVGEQTEGGGDAVRYGVRLERFPCHGVIGGDKIAVCSDPAVGKYKWESLGTA
jgi:hypothetical protein